jgi:hypothetical protein
MVDPFRWDDGWFRTVSEIGRFAGGDTRPTAGLQPRIP